ncbi:GGDEF domain-containing protein [Pseudoalteromonas sp.]|uniref:GGDEF domain-containing protein n=1 Tax=Pseudoalteromonas sp. TaxID=53249 RepID=UPI0035633555
MHKDLLNSVVKITKHRDTDSLELSLLSTISEFLSPKEAALYKDLSRFNSAGIEKSAAIVMEENGVIHWSSREIDNNPCKELLCCIESACTISLQDKQGCEKRWIPVIIDDHVLGAMYIEVNQLNSNEQVALNALCRIYENYLTILNESERDKLTGLLNRQTFDRKIKLLLEDQLHSHNSPVEKGIRNKHYDESSWLAIIDIDHFKQVNDTYGHVCGDEVLLTLSQKMQQFFRASDLIFRFGGEEFVIVFEPSTLLHIATKLAHFQDFISDQKFPFVEELTLSIGFARMSPYDFPISVIENADKALYVAKSNGRNQCIYYGDIIKSENDKNPPPVNDIELF